jgi:MGT family glycosyltransferase
MRFLLTSIGSSGDINPFIALGRELAARGHEATLLVNPYFEPAVRGAGLGFEPLGEYLSPVDVARDMPLAFSRAFGAMVLIRKWFAPLVPRMVKAIADAARHRKPDVLVGHQISFGLPWAARDMRLPWATCILSPATMNSIEDPSVLPLGGDPTRRARWRRRVRAWSARRSISLMLDGPLNTFRRERGLPPHRDTFWGEMFEGNASVGLWSPAFRPRASDDPAHFAVCGFPWHDASPAHGERGARLDPRLERFLDDGPAPVLFTLGSILSHQGRREFEAAVGACRRLGCRGVLVTGRDDAAPRDLRADVLAIDYAPYSLLMPRAAVILHHGGIGTTAQTLRSGRPAIIMPFAHDQFDNAARVQRLGVGRSIPRRFGLARRFARSLESVLTDAAMARRAADLGDRIRAERGTERAAEVLEQIVSPPSGTAPRPDRSPGEASGSRGLVPSPR